jgi:hypothetical protein
MIRGCVVIGVLLSVHVHVIPCWMVRKAVAQYGEQAVESWARSRGILGKEIEGARLCLRQRSAS